MTAARPGPWRLPACGIRRMLCFATGLLCLSFPGRHGWAQPPTLPLPRHVTAETQSAIDSGLEWLAQRQHPSGAFGSPGDYAQNVGVTALCGLAFLSAGSVPEGGRFSEQVQGCTRYLLACAGPDGFITESDVKTHGPMYGHGFATMFLAEVYGSPAAPDVRDPLKRAVGIILSSQNSQGGWRYQPISDEADISVTVCQVMALRAARNAGLAVPKEVIDRAVTYVRRCQNADGGFRYRLFDAAESRQPRSAAAVVALYTAGVQESDTVTRGLEYLQRQEDLRPPQLDEYYFYWVYYAGQAAWHAGDERWDAWYPRNRDLLLESQASDGHWSNPLVGDEYATAMALIALQLPYDYVPIFQR